jgi:hypothetical protein
MKNLNSTIQKAEVIQQVMLEIKLLKLIKFKLNENNLI